MESCTSGEVDRVAVVAWPFGQAGARMYRSGVHQHGKRLVATVGSRRVPCRREGSIMDKASLLRMVAIAAVIPLAVNAGTDPQPTDPPSPGAPCPVLQATAQDNHGHMMWCTNMIDGPDHPVWQYNGSF